MNINRTQTVIFASIDEEEREPNCCPVCGATMKDRFIGDICEECSWECDYGSERFGENKWSYANRQTIEEAINHWWEAKNSK